MSNTFLSSLLFWKQIPESMMRRILFSWILKFFSHALSILGVTIALAYTIAYYGAENLPFVFFMYGSFSIMGSLLVQKLSRNNTPENTIKGILITFIGLIGVTLFSFFFLTPLIFLCALVLSISACMTQLHIFISLYIEDLFSPLESERAFPLIESAEAVGGILSGFLAGVGAMFFSLTWLLGMTGVFGIILLLLMIYFSHEILLSHNHHIHKKSDPISIKELWKKNTLFKNLIFGIFIQGIVFIIVEFQYSLSISFLTSHSQGQSEEILLQELAHGLGLFHLSVYGILLTFHLFFTSAIQKKLGIVYTMILQPIFILFSSITMIFSGSPLSGVSGKGVFEIFGGVSKAAYHSSFYAFKKNNRRNIKEFLEGYARPFGVLLGSGIILLVYGIVVKMNGNLMNVFYIFSILLFVLSLGKLYFFFRLKKNYTQISKNNLETPGLIDEKFDAIEIFAQNGHRNALRVLSHVLHSSHEPLLLKKKVLEVMGRRNDPSVISEILSALSLKDQSLQFSAVSALSEYPNLEKHLRDNIFSRHHLIQRLQHSFLNAESKKLRLAIIQVFKKIQYPEIITFLLDSLQSKDRDTVFCAILACGTFKDISIGGYISPYLFDDDSYIRSAAIITLWPFVRYRSHAIKSLQHMSGSDDMNMKMSAIYTQGEIQQRSEIPRLKKLLNENTDIHIKKHILLSLIKMEEHQYIPDLLQLMFHTDNEVSNTTKKLIFSPGIDKYLHSQIKHFVHRKVWEEVHDIYKQNSNISLEDFEYNTLKKLHFLYSVIDDEIQMMEIDKVMKEVYEN